MGAQFQVRKTPWRARLRRRPHSWRPFPYIFHRYDVWHVDENDRMFFYMAFFWREDAEAKAAQLRA